VPERRRRRNDAIRHEVNDRIAEVAAHLSRGGEGRVSYEFLCECDRPDCRSFIRLTIEEYKKLDVGNTRLVVPDHYDSTVGVVKAAGTGVYAVAYDE
jgi:hypothetical protein